MMVLMYASLSKGLNLPLYPYHMGQCLLSRISIEPNAHLRTWLRRSERLIGAEPLNAGRGGTQYTEIHPRACILNPVKISSVTEPYIHPICISKDTHIPSSCYDNVHIAEVKT